MLVVDVHRSLALLALGRQFFFRSLHDSCTGLAGDEKLGVAGAEYVCPMGSHALRCVFQSDFWQLLSQ